MSSGIETNKIAGAVLTALLVTVGIGHFGAALFGSGEHGEAVMAYPVAAGTTTATEPEAPEALPSVLPLIADASPENGERLFSACRGCHTNNEGGPNSVGPNLWGVVGNDIASHEGYAYSDVLQSLEGDWTYDALNAFIHAPRDVAPGTKMSYAGMPDVESRADLIAYLRTLDGDPEPLPTQEEIDAASGEQQAANGETAAEETAGETVGGDEAAGDETAGDEAAGGDDAAGDDAEPAANDAGAEDAAASEPAESTGEPVAEPTGEETVGDQPASEDSSADESQAEGDAGAGGATGAGPETSGEPVSEPFGEETVGDQPASEDSSANEPQTGDETAGDETAGDETAGDAAADDAAGDAQPATEEPAAAEEPAAEEPAADEPAAGEPATEELPEDGAAEGEGG